MACPQGHPESAEGPRRHLGTLGSCLHLATGPLADSCPDTEARPLPVHPRARAGLPRCQSCGVHDSPTGAMLYLDFFFKGTQSSFILQGHSPPPL